MGKCSAIPKTSRDAMIKAVKDMRKAYGSIDMDAAMRKQVGQACTQGAQGIKQSMAGLGCGS
jgi:hypothetical protein